MRSSGPSGFNGIRANPMNDSTDKLVNISLVIFMAVMSTVGVTVIIQLWMHGFNR